ncbi:hypothetical protein PISMIDRAFT_675815 [Pisolithus microcarpus 441]|uniref:Uncharacterized protein n=1 Tax=Pisolithus microcarpus 441 TaxID=765257 RepID=A0A0C9ZKG5_9AGAM|nr:hypothetical protein PISMIDRAFT_675815 [Pisolithus microcarpus 441]
MCLDATSPDSDADEEITSPFGRTEQPLTTMAWFNSDWNRRSHEYHWSSTTRCIEVGTPSVASYLLPLGK